MQRAAPGFTSKVINASSARCILSSLSQAPYFPLPDSPLTAMLQGRYPYTAVTLCIVYQLIVTMILMSLFTGVMTNALAKAGFWRRHQFGVELWAVASTSSCTLPASSPKSHTFQPTHFVLPHTLNPTQVTQCENLRLLACRAEIIDEMEAALSLLRPWSRAYAALWHPGFLYILRLDPSSKERVSSQRLWVSAKEAEAASGCSSSTRLMEEDSGSGSTQVRGGVEAV